MHTKSIPNGLTPFYQPSSATSDELDGACYALRDNAPSRLEGIMDHIDDVSVEYVEDGHTVVEELDKRILSKGAWSTIVFKYREWDHRADAMGPVKFTIRRYRKVNGQFRQQTKFNISSAKQAEALIDALKGWLEED